MRVLLRVVGGEFAPGADAAFGAFGLAGGADVAPVEDEPVVGGGEDGGGDVPDEFLLGFDGGFGIADEPDAVCDAEDVGVHRHGGLVERHGHHHVRRLAPHAGESLQQVHVLGDDAAELFGELDRHGMEVARLVVGVGYGFNQFVNLLHRACRHGGGGGETVEDGGGGHVHALVGALGGKDDRHQEFIGVGVMELRFGKPHVFGEPA